MASVSVPVVSIVHHPDSAAALDAAALDVALEVEGPGGLKAKVRVDAQTHTLTAVLPSPISVADEDEETERARDALDAAGGNSYQVSDLQLQSREDTVLLALTPVSLVCQITAPAEPARALPQS